MNLTRPVLFTALICTSHFASAALTVTNNGFIDSATNLEWLAPSKVASLSDYNAYVSNGWHVATGIDIGTILTNAYSPFDASLFNAFGIIANASNNESACSYQQTTYCSVGWYSNIGSNGENYGYEIGLIGLLSNPAQTDAALVSQQQLPIGSFYLTSTIGSYSLYGFGDSYSTFMVRAVPLPAAANIFLSAMGCLILGGARRGSHKK